MKDVTELSDESKAMADAVKLLPDSVDWSELSTADWESLKTFLHSRVATDSKKDTTCVLAMISVLQQVAPLRNPVDDDQKTILLDR
jgi:hypothetical protein